MITTRSQSQAQAQAMSTSPAVEATHVSDSPHNTSSQASIGGTPSQGSHKSTKSQVKSPISMMGTYYYHDPRPFHDVRNWTKTSKMGFVQCN